MTENLKNKIGAMFMTGVPSGGVTERFKELCEKYRISNFSISANNAITTQGVCNLTSSIRALAYELTGQYPMICIDQEGGWVTRFYPGAASIPGPMSYAASGADGKKMYEVGKRLGKILRAIGCNVNDAPVLDVNIDPQNPIIGTRAYSDNHQTVTELGVPFAKGLASEGIMSAVKHFPGHGNVSADTHTGTVINTSSVEQLEEKEFSTFRAAFDGGVDAIMTAHVVYPAISDMPATLSHEIMTDLARKNMNFDGIIITDSMRMDAVSTPYPNGEGAVLAIEAGCDILLYYPYNEKDITEAILAVHKAVECGRIPEERINESYDRILCQKKKYRIDVAEPNLTLANSLVYNKTDIDDILSEKLSSITCMKNDGVLDTLCDKRIVCISPVCEALRGVEEKMQQTLSFADEFSKEFENSSPCVSSTKEITPEVRAALGTDFDIAVVGVFDAASNPKQLEIISELKKSGKKVIAVLLRSPYDYRFVSDCNAVLTCYEYTALSCTALVLAMKNNDYRGILPVSILEE